MLAIIRRITVATILGTLVGVIAGPIVGAAVSGILVGISQGGGENNLIPLGFAVMMLVHGPLIGAITGSLTGVVNRPTAGPVIGALMGTTIETIRWANAVRGPLTWLFAYSAIGLVTGIVVGVIVEKRVLQTNPINRPSATGLNEMIQASADSYNRSHLWQWVIFCGLFVALSSYLLLTIINASPFLKQAWITATVLVSLAGIYFGYMLTIKKN